MIQYIYNSETKSFTDNSSHLFGFIAIIKDPETNKCQLYRYDYFYHNDYTLDGYESKKEAISECIDQIQHHYPGFKLVKYKTYSNNVEKSKLELSMKRELK